MRKKYFFFDIDGTLLYNRGQDVSPRTQECLQKLRGNGHEVFIASGRLQADVAQVATRFGIDSFVADGGNSVTYKNELLCMEPLDRAACVAFLEQLEEKQIPWGVIIKNEMVRYGKDERLLELSTSSRLTNIIDPAFDFHAGYDFQKIFVGCRMGEEHRIDFGNLPVVRFNEKSVYIEPDDKARGIYVLMEHLKAPLKDVVVFGDGTNDVKMFQSQWLSIAMGNAREVLKAKADYITTDCDADGIYHACRHFGFI